MSAAEQTQKRHNGYWLRLYTDAYTNIKLRKLPERDQLFFFWALCLHKEGRLVGATAEDLAWHLRVESAHVAGCLSSLKEADLLKKDNTPKGWNERQFESDDVTKRVQKHRMKQAGNVTETLHETFSEAESESRGIEEAEKKGTPSGGEPPAVTSPKKPRAIRFADDKEWLTKVKAEYQPIGVDVDTEMHKARAWLLGPKGRGRKLTQGFFLSWLSKADKTITPQKKYNMYTEAPASWSQTLAAIVEGGMLAEDLDRYIAAAKDKYRDVPRRDGEDVVFYAATVIRDKKRRMTQAESPPSSKAGAA